MAAAILGMAFVAAVPYCLTAVWGLVLADLHFQNTPLRVLPSEWLAVPAPLVVWVLFWLIINGRGKPIANAFIEPVVLGLVVSVIYIVLRRLSSHRLAPETVRVTPFVAACVAGVAVALFMPAFGEG